MKKIIIISFWLFVCMFGIAFAHDGHKDANLDSILLEIGKLHLIMVHFPIALINMAVLAEVIFYFKPKLMYAEAARFMVIWGAILAIPTVLTGLAFSIGVDYDSPLGDILWWHRFSGVVTTLLAILTALWREMHTPWYYAGLAATFIAVNITGYLGGLLAF